MADIHKPLSIIAHAAIVVGIGFTLAHAWFFFWSDPDVAPAESRQAAPKVASRDVPIDRITALNLFGKAPAGPRALTGREATEELRETRLSLTLAGVVVADDPAASIAFIAQRGRPAESFGIGDRLPGNAKLAEVYWDRVVLSRGGMRERLGFEETAGGEGGIVANLGRAPTRQAPRAAPPNGTRQQSAAATRPARSALAERRTALAAIRERLENNPEAALDGLGMDQEAMRAGGYVVGALADHPELRGLGLARSDRILSVNGQPLGEVDDPGQALERVLAQESATIEIQRGERRFAVTIALAWKRRPRERSDRAGLSRERGGAGPTAEAAPGGKGRLDRQNLGRRQMSTFESGARPNVRRLQWITGT